MNISRYLFCTAKQFEYLYGINPIMAALYANRRISQELMVNQNQQNDHLNPRVANILNKANQMKIPVKMIDKKKLERFCGSQQSHQNVILKCSQMQFSQTIPEKQDLVLLDQVQDPQNFGAILRVCFFLGINTVLVESKGACPLSPTVSKTSAGAMEMMQILQVTDITQFVKQRKNTHIVYGTGFEKNSVPFDSLNSINNNDLGDKKNKLIILGSEAFGVRYDVLRLCDYVLNIPSKRTEFPETLVDSLNVSVSAGIILQQLLRN